MARIEPLGIHEVDTEIRHLCEETERQAELIANEAHLRSVLQEGATSSNAERPHRRPDLSPPLPIARTRSPTGPIHARAVLGGLHHVHERAA